MADDFKCIFELEERTIEALLLGFNEPLHHLYKEYNIPSPHMIEDFLERVKRKDLQIRVQDGLSKIRMRGTAGPELGTNRLEDYMHGWTSHSLIWEWFPCYGDLFKFMSNAREDAEKKMRAYWTSEELKDFQNINGVMQKLAVGYYKEKENVRCSK